MTIRPGVSPCLACLMETQQLGLEETCDTIGVLGPIVHLMASLEAAEAMKLLAGRTDALHGRLISCDVRTGHFQSLRLALNPDCHACPRRDFTYLHSESPPPLTTRATHS